MTVAVKTHSKLSPSRASTWCECTAQPGYLEHNAHRLPPEIPSVYAEEGTRAHLYAQEVLVDTIGIDAVPEPFRPFIRSYVDTCRSLTTPTALSFVEREMPLFYLPEDIGTVDFVSVDGALHVRDLKYGSGKLVESKGNRQLAIYAWNTVLHLAPLFDFSDDFPVSIQAVQPRHYEWVDRPWNITIGELREFIEREIVPHAEAILNGGPVVFSPGPETCQWCPAKGFCEARAAWLRELPPEFNPLDHFENLDMMDAPEVTALTEAQLVSIFRHAKLIRDFIEDVEDYMTQMALGGSAVPGTKLVAGRAGNRKWTDEQAAASLLGKLGLDWTEFYEAKLRTPAACEKALKDHGVSTAPLAEVCTRSIGQPVLALESDKRPALTTGIEEFCDLDDGIE